MSAISKPAPNSPERTKSSIEKFDFNETRLDPLKKIDGDIE